MLSSRYSKKIRQARGGKQRDVTKGQRCDACGKSGHNAHTCKITVEIFNEEDGDEN